MIAAADASAALALFKRAQSDRLISASVTIPQRFVTDLGVPVPSVSLANAIENTLGLQAGSVYDVLVRLPLFCVPLDLLLSVWPNRS